MDLDYEIRRLQNIPSLKKIMDENIARHPEFYDIGQRLLKDFFWRNPSPKDIAIILYDGIDDTHVLAHYLEGNNLMFYRPSSKHRRDKFQPFFRGIMHPERELLLFDKDVVTGKTLIETSEFFASNGYNKRKMFAYLEAGISGFVNKTTLKKVDEIIKMVIDVPVGD